jgi:alpha-tubulin suppressor-like RCC1 family protein
VALTAAAAIAQGGGDQPAHSAGANTAVAPAGLAAPQAGTPIEAGTVQNGLPQVRQMIAPQVLPKPGGVEVQSRKDYRSVDTGVTVFNNTAYIWGYASDGLSGGDGTAAADPEDQQYPPTPVQNLPQGVIVDIAGGIYNFNATDMQGCVWGWGTYGWHDGSGDRWYAYPPVKIRIGGQWNDTSKPYLCNVQVLSRTERSGAAITKDGLVYSWGIGQMGGPGPDSSANKVGAKLVSGLPNPSIEGNRPVALEGGNATYWLILENGDVWYFGNDDYLGSIWNHERPDGDENSGYSGGRTQAELNKGLPQIAMPSKGLAPWFRSRNPEEYIVQVHSGIAFGAALLSTGRVLTWGVDSRVGAIGRPCTTGNTAAKEACARNPGYVDFGTRKPKIVSISCAFTATAALAQDGVLYGWAKPERSYENLPDNRKLNYGPATLPQVSSFSGPGSVVEISKNVTSFQSGQGYFIWQLENGEYWGRGYNPRGSLGHEAGNYGEAGIFDTVTRPVWFAKPYYRGCWVTNQTSPSHTSTSKWPGDQIMFGSGTYSFQGKSYKCTDLNIKNPDGSWKNRYTMDDCLAGKCGL